MLEREFKYYRDHQSELLEKYNGRVLVIIGERVVESYDTYDEAFNDSIKKYSPGTFLIQECGPGEELYTQHFHYKSRAIFT
jgi:hypothetical protein